MKKLRLLTKSLLVVAGLLMGATSAWAEVEETVVVNCDFSKGETLFANTSRITVTNDNNAKFVTASDAINGYSLATYNFSSAIGADATAIKVEFAYWIPNSNASYYRYFTLGQANLRTGFARYAYSSSGAMFGMGLKRGKWNNAGSNVNYFSVNDGFTSQTGENVLGAWARAEVYIDFSAKKISYKITNVENTSTYFSADNVDYLDGDATYCNQIDFFDCANSTTSYLDNLVITKYVDKSKVPTTYTVKFQNASGTDLKDAVEYDTYVGDTYTASAADMATFYSDDTNTKYVFKSGNTSATAVETAASNVVTLVFDEYSKIDYTVKAQVSGADLTTLASGSAYTDGSTIASYSKYINVDDTWYETNSPYGIAITTANNNVAYTAVDNVDYFFECEDQTYSKSFNSYSGTEVSNGSAKTLGASDATVTTTTTIAAGTYTITLSGKKWGDYEDDYELAYSTDGTNWVAVGNFTYASSEEGEKTLSGILIPGDSYIRLRTTKGAQTPRRYLDYIVLQKTGDATVSVTANAYGYQTFACDYALDFSGTTTKAYIATGESDGKVTMTRVNKVPANTGLFLQCGANEDIPVLTTAADDVSANKFVRGTGAAVDKGTSSNRYVLGVDGSSVAFYLINATAATVGTNQAYLEIGGTGARLAISFEDETTGINAIQGSGLKVNGSENFYNLQGQRVVAPQKGLFIMNGKKVIMK